MTPQQTPRVSGPILKQPAFDWKTPDKYHEFKNLEIEARNILTNN